MAISCYAWWNYLVIRVPLKNKTCANTTRRFNCSFANCKLDNSRRNLDKCARTCHKFKPVFWERVRLAWKVLTWKDVKC